MSSAWSVAGVGPRNLTGHIPSRCRPRHSRAMRLRPDSWCSIQAPLLGAFIFLAIGPRALAGGDADEAQLSREASLPALLARALERSPDLGAERQRALSSR